MSIDDFDYLGELTNKQPDGDRDKGEEEVIKEMSMKTQALSQEVVVAKRREAIGKKGEEEAEANGTSSTWVGGQYDVDVVVLCCLMVDRSYIVDREPARRMEATSKRECANLFSSSTFSPFSRLSSFPPLDLPIGQKLPRP